MEWISTKIIMNDICQVDNNNNNINNMINNDLDKHIQVKTNDR